MLLRQFLILVVEAREPPFVQAVDIGLAALFRRCRDDRRQRGSGQRGDFAIGQAASVDANVLNRRAGQRRRLVALADLERHGRANGFRERVGLHIRRLRFAVYVDVHAGRFLACRRT